MMGVRKGELWKKSGDKAFCEAKPDKEGRRPLEWRRGFNYTEIPISTWSVTRQWKVHDTLGAISAIDKTMDELYAEVSTDPSSMLRLELSVDAKAMRDRFCFFEKSDEDRSLFEITRSAGPTRVLIVERDVAGEKAGPLSKAIPSSVFRANYEPGEDCVVIQLGLPAADIQQLIDRLSSRESESLLLRILLDAYTYEVDDALREPYHPQTFAIDQSSFAFIDSIDLRCTSRALAKEIPAEAHDEYNDAAVDDEPHAAAGPLMGQIPAVLNVDRVAVALEKMATAVWVAVITAVVIAFFRH